MQWVAGLTPRSNTVKYNAHPPSTFCTSGAHVRPPLAQAGRWGSASIRLPQRPRRVPIHNGTFKKKPPSLV